MDGASCQNLAQRSGGSALAANHLAQILVGNLDLQARRMASVGISHDNFPRLINQQSKYLGEVVSNVRHVQATDSFWLRTSLATVADI